MAVGSKNGTPEAENLYLNSSKAGLKSFLSSSVSALVFSCGVVRSSSPSSSLMNNSAAPSHVLSSAHAH